MADPADHQPDSADATPSPGPERSGVGGAVEFDRVVPPAGNLQLAGRQLWLGPARSGQVATRAGTVVLGGHAVLAAEILAGRQIGIRIERDTLMFFDLDSRELMRVAAEPVAPRPDRPAPGEPAGRTAAPIVDRTGPGPAPRVQYRRDHRVPPNGVAGPHPSASVSWSDE